MIDRHAFDDGLEEHGLSGACRSDDECALSVPDWRDQVDGSTRELGSALGRFPGLELELPLGIGSNERAEIRTPRGLFRIGAVDLFDVDYYDAIAVIVARRGENLVASAQHVLPHDLRRHVRVAGFSQVAVRCSADEAALTLRIVPAGCLAIGNDRSCWCAIALLLLLLLGAWPALLLSGLALSATSALIASTTSVVAILALAGMAVLIAIALLLATARLRVVLLVLRGVASGARSVYWRRRRRGRIRFGV